MKKLGLVFTDGVSLEQWVDQGLFSREKQIYEEHLKQNHFDKIVWFTYGINDQYIRNELVQNGELDEKILVIPMPKLFDNKVLKPLYSYLIPYIHRNECKELDIIKTNQMAGAWTAAIIHKKYGIPFLLRTGYTYSTNYRRLYEQEKKIRKKIKYYYKSRKYIGIEKKIYRICNWATVSSKHDKEYICANCHVSSKKIEIVGNYVDTNLFKPKKGMERKNRFIYVGRYGTEKNLFNMIKAMEQAHVGVDLYGSGELQHELESFIQQNGYDAQLKGSVDNKELPNILNQYRYFILVSHHEGMPKALLEAMACGLICVGTNVEGINEVIRDEYNGVIANEINADSISRAVIKALNIEIQKKIYRNLDKEIQNYSLRMIVEKEWEVISKMILK